MAHPAPTQFNISFRSLHLADMQTFAKVSDGLWLKIKQLTLLNQLSKQSGEHAKEVLAVVLFSFRCLQFAKCKYSYTGVGGSVAELMDQANLEGYQAK